MQVRLNRRSPTEGVGTFSSTVIQYCTQLMVLHGIKTLESKESRSGLVVKRTNFATPFEECPEELARHSAMVKDSLAEILASVGVVDVEVVLTREELENCLAEWRTVAYDMLSMEGSALPEREGSSEAVY